MNQTKKINKKILALKEEMAKGVLQGCNAEEVEKNERGGERKEKEEKTNERNMKEERKEGPNSSFSPNKSFN